MNKEGSSRGLLAVGCALWLALAGAGFGQVITTVAGNGTAGYAGDGGDALGAQLSTPYGVFVDAQGNVYIPDPGNHRVRKVDKVTGIITTVAGTGAPGFSGDGCPTGRASACR